jgi:hypothetical protein
VSWGLSLFFFATVTGCHCSRMFLVDVDLVHGHVFCS